MTIGLKLSLLSTTSSSSDSSGLAISFGQGPLGTRVLAVLLALLCPSDSLLLPSLTSSARTSLMSASAPSLFSTAWIWSPAYPSFKAKSILAWYSLSKFVLHSSSFKSCVILLCEKLGRSKQGERQSGRCGLVETSFSLHWVLLQLLLKYGCSGSLSELVHSSDSALHSPASCSTFLSPLECLFSIFSFPTIDQAVITFSFQPELSSLSFPKPPGIHTQLHCVGQLKVDTRLELMCLAYCVLA